MAASCFFATIALLLLILSTWAESSKLPVIELCYSQLQNGHKHIFQVSKSVWAKQEENFFHTLLNFNGATQQGLAECPVEFELMEIAVKFMQVRAKTALPEFEKMRVVPHSAFSQLVPDAYVQLAEILPDDMSGVVELLEAADYLHMNALRSLAILKLAHLIQDHSLVRI